MTTRTALLCLGGLVAVSLAGCSGGTTDVSKQLNDDYHNHKAGAPPPPGAMSGPKGGSVGPFKDSGGVPPGSGAPVTGAGSGPGKAPPGITPGAGKSAADK